MKHVRVNLFSVACMALIMGILPVSSYAATPNASLDQFVMALIMGILPVSSYAAMPNEIDASVNASIDRFVKEVKGAQEFLNAAKGVLIIPKVMQGGLVVGGEYGEGALRIGGKTVGYYSIASASLGAQLGAQQKDIILVFMSQKVLKKFRTGKNWRAGVDAKVTLINVGVDESLSTMKFKQPVVGFVFGQKGLMAGATIEGSKFTKMKK
jgi:lipid-binding SYLF domain-containing protein